MVDYPHKIFIVFPGSNYPYQIPVPPETIAGGTGSIIKTFELISIGEAITLGGIKLEQFKWESHFPKQYDPDIEVVSRGEHIDPAIWYRNIVEAEKSQTPVRITIQNTPIDFKAAISSFKWSYVPGAFGDIWYQIEMVQYRQGYIREFDGVTLPLLIPREDSLPPLGKDDVDRMGSFYITKRGDTFESISIKFFGTDKYARQIYDNNKKTMDRVIQSSVKENDLLRKPSSPSVSFKWTWGDPLPANITLIIPKIATDQNQFQGPWGDDYGT